MSQNSKNAEPRTVNQQYSKPYFLILIMILISLFTLNLWMNYQSLKEETAELRAKVNALHEFISINNNFTSEAINISA